MSAGALCHECGADLGRPGPKIPPGEAYYTYVERRRFRCGVCNRLKCGEHAGEHLPIGCVGSTSTILCCKQCVDAGVDVATLDLGSDSTTTPGRS